METPNQKTRKIRSLHEKKKFGIWDPEKPIPHPGSRGQKGTGSRARIRNTAKLLFDSVALLSRILDPDFFPPDIRFSNNKKEEGEKM
jgi:hypothetical protein